MKMDSNNIMNPNNRDIFNKYLAEISKLQPLSKDEEIDLFKQIEINKDNQQAIDKLCKHNLLFVVSVAKKYSKTIDKSSLTLEDLVNDGNIGLCIAVRRFDYKTGNKFISYAVWWIQAMILKSIQDNVKSIRIPQNARLILTKIKKQEDKLEQKFSRYPTTLEIFEGMVEDGDTKANDTVYKMDELINISTFEKSLNSLISVDGSTELGEMVVCEELKPDELLLAQEKNKLITSILDSLPDLIKNYFIDFYGFSGEKPLTVVQMGEKYDDIPATIRLRMGKYLRQLKHTNRTKKRFLLSTY